ncbi:MAG: hypothetical protein OSB45_14295 [Pseudomonadales bacterium]|nr:hypothetical protein [Pseudomonadales bacterium]
MKTQILLVGVLGIFLTSCLTSCDRESQESADLILTGAKVFTSNVQRPWAEAVAIKNGRFIYVGDAAGIARY